MSRGRSEHRSKIHRPRPVNPLAQTQTRLLQFLSRVASRREPARPVERFSRHVVAWVLRCSVTPFTTAQSRLAHFTTGPFATGSLATGASVRGVAARHHDSSPQVAPSSSGVVYDDRRPLALTHQR